jgi:hypothetical protein
MSDNIYTVPLIFFHLLNSQLGIAMSSAINYLHADDVVDDLAIVSPYL